MLVAQWREGSRGQTAAPVRLVMCGRLLDPAEFASAAGLVVDAEQLVSVEEGGSLAPADTLLRPGVPPEHPRFRDTA
jgi:hypothetical protein